MAEKEERRPRTRLTYRRPSRDSVTSAPGVHPDDPGDEGAAGVREPRRPKPNGPVSGAGVKPEPVPEYVVALPDPRY